MQGIGQLRLGLVGQGPLKLLGDALSDKHLHCRVRMEAARALGTLKDDLGEPVGEANFHLLLFFCAYLCALHAPFNHGPGSNSGVCRSENSS